MSNFKIRYRLLDKNQTLIKAGEIIAKNKMSEFDALAGTEMYLKKKYPEADKMQAVSILVDSLIGYIPVPNRFRKDNPEDILKSFFGL